MFFVPRAKPEVRKEPRFHGRVYERYFLFRWVHKDLGLVAGPSTLSFARPARLAELQPKRTGKTILKTRVFQKCSTSNLVYFCNPRERTSHLRASCQDPEILILLTCIIIPTKLDNNTNGRTDL